MFNISEIGSRAVAAVSSLVISGVLFAYAIVPAEQGAVFAGMMA